MQTFTFYYDMDSFLQVESVGSSDKAASEGSSSLDFKAYFSKSHPERGKPNSPESKFINACKSGDLKTVEFILLTRNSDFDINYTGNVEIWSFWSKNPVRKVHEWNHGVMLPQKNFSSKSSRLINEQNKTVI